MRRRISTVVSLKPATADASMKPFRNGVMPSVAIGYAVRLRFQLAAFALHPSKDHGRQS